jgi:hypothetical protein
VVLLRWTEEATEEQKQRVAYRDHPEHQAMISQFILPVAAQRVAVQYEF